jgi:hypothetical protein
MKFYEKTEPGVIYVTTHDAVLAARNALYSGISFLFSYKTLIFFAI